MTQSHPHRSCHRPWFRTVGALALTFLPACSTPRAQTTTIAFPQDSRDRAFTLARDALRDAGYRLDRVDHAHGVLTTQAQPSGGSPFTSTPTQDVLHEQSRVVRVEFDDTGSVARVACFVSRTHTPTMHLSTRAVGLSATAYDPTQAERATAFRFTAPLTRDEDEARRIAARIQKALEAQP